MRWLRQVLLATQAGEPEHGVDVAFRVVLVGWCGSVSSTTPVLSMQPDSRRPSFRIARMPSLSVPLGLPAIGLSTDGC